jgi:hypothetical protein
MRNPVGFVSFIFVGLSIPYILAEYDDVGIQCIMYASISYYAIFVYFGYAIVHTQNEQQRFIYLFYYAILLSNCHALLGAFIPLREISPLINGIPLLGGGGSSYIYFSLGIGYAIMYGQILGRIKSTVLLILSLVTYIIGMERGSMLGVIAVIFLLLWYRKIWLLHTVSRITQMLIIGAVFSTLFVILCAPKSLISQKITDQGYLFLSTIGDTPNLEGKSGTKEHRLSMWRQVITETIREDPWFGQGFRDQLIEETFRNPHNSFVSIFGRMGTIGLSIALVIYIIFPFWVAWRLRSFGHGPLNQHLLFYSCFVIAFLSYGLFSTALESPYCSLVVNFIYGAFLRCAELHSCINNPYTMRNPYNESTSYPQ